MNSIEHSKKVKKVLKRALALNLLVCIAKLSYGLFTGTLTMLVDGIHSLMDSASSIMGYVSIEYAHRPSDENHHYGHSKFETLATLGIGAFIAISSWEVLQMAVGRLIAEEESSFHYSGIVIVVITMVINFFLSKYESKEGKKLNSRILQADAIHTSSDFWVSSTVLLSLFAIKYQFQIVDTIFSLLIAVYFGKHAYQLLKENTLVLSDAAFLNVEDIKTMVLENPKVIGCHHIRTRGTKDHAFLDFHIQIDASMDTASSHRLVHSIENELKQAYPGLQDVLIHTEPFPDHDESFVTD
ncbi:MAG: cation transporter [Bdellovibrionales bacterium]|nr:cation transporter [Bdellovibrionales bacterium]